MNYVIIGNSAAGVACVEAIRSRDKKSKITIISEETYHIYSRCLLSYYLAGDIKEEKLVYRTDDFYKENNVETMIGSLCEKVLPKEKTVKLKGGGSVKFDSLLIATGARSKFPDMKGAEKDGFLGLRTIKDAGLLLSRLKNVKTAAILGGGLIGLKAAYGISAHKKDVRVIVKSNQVLSQVLDKKAGAIFQDWIAKKGISIMTGLEALEVLGKSAVEGVRLDNGKTLDCQMVIVGKGVLPNTEIVKDTGIKIGEGIMVDEHLATSVDSIYAAGDVAQARDRITGETGIHALWPIAVEEGRIAGLNMAGEKAVYDGSMGMNAVEFFGLPLVSMGLARPKEGLEELTCEDKARNIYKKVVLKGNVIVGMIFVGDIRSAGVIGGLIKNRIDISSVKDALLDERFDFAKIAGLVKENAGKFSSDEFKDIILTY